jgi:hypothetical protein
MVQAVDHLPSKHEAMSLNSSTTIKNSLRWRLKNDKAGEGDGDKRQ